MYATLPNHQQNTTSITCGRNPDDGSIFYDNNNSISNNTDTDFMYSSSAIYSCLHQKKKQEASFSAPLFSSTTNGGVVVIANGGTRQVKRRAVRRGIGAQQERTTTSDDIVVMRRRCRGNTHSVMMFFTVIILWLLLLVQGGAGGGGLPRSDEGLFGPAASCGVFQSCEWGPTKTTAIPTTPHTALSMLFFNSNSGSSSSIVTFASARTLATTEQNNYDGTTTTLLVQDLDFYNRDKPTVSMKWTASTFLIELMALYDGTPYDFTFRNNNFGDPMNTNPTRLVIEGAITGAENPAGCGPMHVTIAGNVFRHSSITFTRYIPAGSTIDIYNNSFFEFEPLSGLVFMVQIKLTFLTTPRPSSVSGGGPDEIGFERFIVENNTMISKVDTAGPDDLISFVEIDLVGPQYGGFPKYQCLIAVRRNIIHRSVVNGDTVGISVMSANAKTQPTPSIKGRGQVLIEGNSISLIDSISGSSSSSSSPPKLRSFAHGVMFIIAQTSGTGSIEFSDGGSLAVRGNMIEIGGGLAGLGGGPVAKDGYDSAVVGCVSVMGAAKTRLINGGKMFFEGNLCNLSDSRDTHAFALGQSGFVFDGTDSSILISNNVIIPPSRGSYAPSVEANPSATPAAPPQLLCPYLIVLGPWFGYAKGPRAGFRIADNTFAGNSLISYCGVYVGFVRESATEPDFVFEKGAVMEISRNVVHGASEAFVALRSLLVPPSPRSPPVVTSQQISQTLSQMTNVPQIRWGPLLSFSSPSSSFAVLGNGAPIGQRLTTAYLSAFHFIQVNALVTPRSGAKIIIEGNAAMQSVDSYIETTGANVGFLTNIVGIHYKGGVAANINSDPEGDYTAIPQPPAFGSIYRPLVPSSSGGGGFPVTNPSSPQASDTQSSVSSGSSSGNYLSVELAGFPDIVGALLIRKNVILGVNGSVHYGLLVESDTMSVQGPYATVDVSANKAIHCPTLVLYTPSVRSGSLALSPIMFRPRILNLSDFSYDSTTLKTIDGSTISASAIAAQSKGVAIGINNNDVVYSTLNVLKFISDSSSAAASSGQLSLTGLVVTTGLLNTRLCSLPTASSPSTTNCVNGVLSISGNRIIANSTRSTAGLAIYSSIAGSGPALRVGGSSRLQINGNYAEVRPCEGDSECGSTLDTATPSAIPRQSAFHFAFDYVAFESSSVFSISRNTFVVHTGNRGADNFPILNAMRVYAGGASAGPNNAVTPQSSRGRFVSADLQDNTSSSVGDNSYDAHNSPRGLGMHAEVYRARGLLFSPLASASDDNRYGFNFSGGSLFYIVDNSAVVEGRYFYKHLVAVSLDLGLLHAGLNSHIFILRNRMVARANGDDVQTNWYGPILGIGLHIAHTSITLGPNDAYNYGAVGFKLLAPPDVNNLATLHISQNFVNVDSPGDVTHGIVIGDPINPTGPAPATKLYIASIGCSAAVGDRATFHSRFGGGSGSSSGFYFPEDGERIVLGAKRSGGSLDPTASSTSPIICSGIYMYDNGLDVRGTPDEVDSGGSLFSVLAEVKLLEGAQFHLVRNYLTYEDTHRDEASPSWVVPRALVFSPPNAGVRSRCEFGGAASTVAIANNSLTLTSRNADRFVSFCEGQPGAGGTYESSGLLLRHNATITFEFNTFGQAAPQTALPIRLQKMTHLASNAPVTYPYGWFSVQCNVFRDAVIVSYDQTVINDPSVVSEVKGCTLVVTTTTTTTATTTTTSTTTPTTTTTTTTPTTTTTTTPTTTTTTTTTPTTTTTTTTTPLTTTTDPWWNAPPACIDPNYRVAFLSSLPLVEDRVAPLLVKDSVLTVTEANIRQGVDVLFDVETIKMYLEETSSLSAADGNGGSSRTLVDTKGVAVPFFTSASFDSARVLKKSVFPAPVAANFDGFSGETVALPRVQLAITKRSHFVPSRRTFVGLYDENTNTLYKDTSQVPTTPTGSSTGNSNNKSNNKLKALYKEVTAVTTFRLRTEPRPSFSILADEQFNIEESVSKILLSVSRDEFDVNSSSSPSPSTTTSASPSGGSPPVLPPPSHSYSNGTVNFNVPEPPWETSSSLPTTTSSPSGTTVPTTAPSGGGALLPGECDALRDSIVSVVGVRVVRTTEDPKQAARVASTAVTIAASLTGMFLGLGGAAADLQTVVLLGFMGCADPETHEHFYNYRILSPFAFDSSYVGVLVGNMIGAGIVLTIQLIALVAVKLSNRTRRWVELQAKVMFPSVTLAALFSFFVGTMWSLSRLVTPYPNYYRYHIIPGEELVDETDSEFFGETSSSRTEYFPNGTAIAVFAILMVSAIALAIALFFFAWRRLERAYQSYVLDDWLLQPSLQGSFLTSRFSSTFFIPEGAVYSEETRTAYGSYVAPYVIKDHFWTTYPLWGGFVLFFFGLWIPSSVVECQAYLCLLAFFFIGFAALIVYFQPFRSWGDNLMAVVSKVIVAVAFFAAAASASGLDKTRAPTVIMVAFAVLAGVTFFRIIMHGFMLFYDRRFKVDLVSVAEEWSHTPLEDRSRRKHFGVDGADEELIKAASNRVERDDEIAKRDQQRVNLNSGGGGGDGLGIGAGSAGVPLQEDDGAGFFLNLNADGVISVSGGSGRADDEELSMLIMQNTADKHENEEEKGGGATSTAQSKSKYPIRSNNLSNNSIYARRDERGTNIFAKKDADDDDSNGSANGWLREAMSTAAYFDNQGGRGRVAPPPSIIPIDDDVDVSNKNKEGRARGGRARGGGGRGEEGGGAKKPAKVLLSSSSSSSSVDLDAVEEAVSVSSDPRHTNSTNVAVSGTLSKPTQSNPAPAATSTTSASPPRRGRGGGGGGAPKAARQRSAKSLLEEDDAL